MKNKLGIFISVISIILFAIYIDYDYAKRTNKLPKLVFKNDGNYIGLFYKVFKCDDVLSFSNYSVKKVKCEKEISNYYVNNNGVKIDKERYNMIKDLFSTDLEKFTSDDDVDDAYYVTKEYNEKTFKVIDGSAFLDNDITYSLVNFYKWSNEKWVINEKKYCMTVKDSKFKIYEYKNGKCNDEIDVEPSKKFCDIINNNKILQKDFLVKFCK